MSNNQKSQPTGIKILRVADKILSLGAIFYGIYLYFYTGQFFTDDYFYNPALWIIGGSVSLIIGFIDLPSLMFRIMKRKMVVNR
jgi:hypothetical protein